MTNSNMKILYGIQGTGNGHISRSTQVVDQLQHCGAQIDVLLSGCQKDKIYDSTVIDPMAFYKGFTFTTKDGSIQYLNTIKNLSLLRFAKDVMSFDAQKYDLVITDFEPVSAMIAKKEKLPCIGIGHQYAFLHDIPIKRTNILDQVIIKNFASARYPVGMHWHHFDQPIIPPIVPHDILLPIERDPSLILVYLPFENPEHTRKILEPFEDYTFTVYAGNSDPYTRREKNICWHPFSKTGFYEDLAKCSGVICNAGFELPSEALFLGKKLLVKPLKGQFEQLSNAMTLEKLELGVTMERLDPPIIKKFLKRTSSPQKQYPNVAKHLADWIFKGNWSDTSDLIHTVWN